MPKRFIGDSLPPNTKLNARGPVGEWIAFLTREWGVFGEDWPGVLHLVKLRPEFHEKLKEECPEWASGPALILFTQYLAHHHPALVKPWNCSESAPAPGYVYAVECAGRMKIGYTANIEKRLASFQHSYPRPVYLLFSVKCPNQKLARWLESELHAGLAPERLQGEWFVLDQDTAYCVLDRMVDCGEWNSTERGDMWRSGITPPPYQQASLHLN